MIATGSPRNRRTKTLYLALLCALALGWAPRVAPAQDKSYLKAGDEDVQWWRQLKFGLFVHWGPVSLKGTEIGWSRGGERRGTGGTGEIPVEVYDNLYKQFNPVEFNADEWVQIAQDAGMRYLVFTSKHHDGFCMFDTNLTDYKITNSPFKRDVVGELAAACHESGLRLGYYYSPVDWHHPDYRTVNHPRYIEYLHGQLREICSNYGQIDIVWFDGLGGTAQDWDSENLFKIIRTLQPHVIINNRAGLPADHDTPEQTIGGFQRDRPWETCMTICQQWAWKPNDQMKSLKECLQTLVRVVGGDGNLLFNVGPMPDGRIEPRQVDRLREMGDWLRTYGESIYGTRGGPFKTTAWLASTCRDNVIYVHILDWPSEVVTLPALPRRITASSLLLGGGVNVRQTAEAIEIRVVPRNRSEIDTIVRLELDGPAGAIEPLALASGSLAAGRKATASNVFQNSPDYGPARAFDDDPGTRWATDYGVRQAWLAVDLGKPMAFGSVSLSEAYDRVRQFELQYQEGDAWKTFLSGTRIGEKFTQDFAPVTAQCVRLNILEATDGPTIWEFQLLPPGRGDREAHSLSSN
jgi:alpha-L-fucosidase